MCIFSITLKRGGWEEFQPNQKSLRVKARVSLYLNNFGIKKYVGVFPLLHARPQISALISTASFQTQIEINSGSNKRLPLTSILPQNAVFIKISP